MNDSQSPAEALVSSPNWRWLEGMRDHRGRRIVDLDLWDNEGVPDLLDGGTAGLLLQQLDQTGHLTDVVKSQGMWIVAVELPSGVQGYAADSMGEAAAWAQLSVWDDEEQMQTAGIDA